MDQFDNAAIIRRVHEIAKKKGMRIGDLERRLGVSAGYLSRLAKRQAARVPASIVAYIAAILGTTTDTLLLGTAQDANEDRLCRFLDKLRTDTLSGRLEWKPDAPGIASSWDAPVTDGASARLSLSPAGPSLYMVQGGKDHLLCRPDDRAFAPRLDALLDAVEHTGSSGRVLEIIDRFMEVHAGRTGARA